MQIGNNSEADGYSSGWVAYLRLDLNFTDLPNDCVLRIAELEAYAV